MNTIIKRKTHHHIVGVHALCSCNLEKIIALSHVAASSRIVFQAFNLFNSFMYRGYIISAIMNVATVKLNIKFRFCNIIENM